MSRSSRFRFTAAAVLSEAGRWLLLASLIYAPWAFGTTRDWTIEILETALFAMGAIWVSGLLLKERGGECRTRCRLPMPLMILSVLILCWGWSVTWNAHMYFDPYLLRFIPSQPLTRFWPGTVDQGASRASMMRISALFMALAVSIDAAQDRVWRKRILMTMAGTGISIALFGIAQKIARAPLLFWEAERFSQTNFAMYRYHANAGAYLNLVWPIAGALAYEAFRRPERFLQRAIWLPGALMMMASVALNISKGGHLIAVLILIAAMIMGFREFRGRFIRWRAGRIAVALSVIAVLVAVSVYIGTDAAIGRWADFMRGPQEDERRIAMARACMEMAKQRPWCGFGPGTFSLVFPFFSRPFGADLGGVWTYAHCDYLQTLVEWGVLGCVLWGAIFGAGLVLLGRRVIARRGALMDAAVLLSLGGVLLHAAFDFPLQIASIQLYTSTLLGFAWARGLEQRGNIVPWELLESWR